jgi:serine/threonine-protein kinase
MTISEARKRLESLDLVIHAGPNPTRGMIRSQNPLAGTIVQRGSTVHVHFAQTATPVLVPDVKNLTFGMAAQRVQAAGLRIRAGNAEHGPVVSQTPAPGQKVARDTLVTVRFAQPKPPVHVPNVVGLTDAEARHRLQTVGLRIQHGNAVHGRVKSQSPAAGKSVARDTTVTVFFTQAPAPVRVPNVIGLTHAEANKQLHAVGLRIRAGNAIHGKVTRQSPAAGTSATRDSQVTVFYPATHHAHR